MFDMEGWSNEFYSRAREPMGDALHRTFAALLAAERDPGFSIPGLSGEFLFRLVESRANFIGLELSYAAKAFLTVLSGRPGVAVMYLSALRSRYAKAGMEQIALAFPDGFLPESDLEEMWDRQKGIYCGEKADNCLDAWRFV